MLEAFFAAKKVYYNFDTTKDAIKSNKGIYSFFDRYGGNIAATQAASKRNEILFVTKKLYVFVAGEIVDNTMLASPITRGAVKMSEQIVAATEIIDQATLLFERQFDKFNAASDKAMSEMKQRISQLTDYNNRLANSLNNINKTLGDERMVNALVNAEKLSLALDLLDKLEQKGNLKKIMEAMKD